LKTFSCSSRPNNAHLSAQHSKQHKGNKTKKAPKKNRNATKKQVEEGEGEEEKGFERSYN
jgi:hypothetical protein